MKVHALAALLLALAVSPAQGPTGTTAAPAPAPVRIHIIGASVSAGFEDGPLFGATKQGDSVPLQTVFRAFCGDLGTVSMHPALDMCAMFREPFEVGERQIALLKKRKPDVVLAVDFPFWFAYGYVGDQEQQERSARLRKGLQMLADLDLPVLLGDLPDMTGAAQRMLNPRQVPSPKVLAALDEQLRTFVAKHPKLRLVPLSGLVADMKQKGLDLPLAAGPLPTAPGALLQEDRLHATRLGVAYLCFQLRPHLAARLPDEHELERRSWTFEQFVEAAGAEHELAALVEAASAGGKKEE